MVYLTSINSDKGFLKNEHLEKVRHFDNHGS